MKIFELFEVSGKPNRNDCRYTEYRVYNNSLYIEAECLVDCMDLDEETTDEEYNELVEKALLDIVITLERYGRYPKNGIPRYVAY